MLIQATATAEDRIVTDVSANRDLAALAERLAVRQPAGALWSSWLGKRLWWSYHMRILIYVTPRRAWFWRNRDFASPPEELDISEVRGVG